MRTSVMTAIVAVMLVARIANAQPAPWEPERLTPGWVFTPSIVFGGLRDSNVTLRAVNEPIRSEWVGLLNPRGEIDFNGRRTHMNAGYSGSLEAYRQFSELNRYEQVGRFELRQAAAEHLQLFAHAGYSKVPTTDRLDLGGGVLPFVGVGSRHADASGGFQLQVSPRTQIDGNLSAQAIRFERVGDQAPTEFDRYLRSGYSWSPSLGVMHGISQRVSVGAALSYGHTEVDSGLNKFNVYTETAELSYQTGPHTTVRGGAGASYLTSSTDDISLWGPAYHVSLEHKAGRVSVDGRYEHTFVPSIGFGGANASQRMSASAHVPVAQGRWIFGGSLGYGEIAPIEQLDINFTVHSLWTQGTVGYQISPWLRAEGFLNRTHQTSTARGLIDRTRVGIEFVTSKPVRIQ
ncbi:MAG TPA: hypothetical protein VL173_01390 [Vicinamibacterales bacterium]|nr:hypothetical protein [Vicinamibacterales bacterium]